MLRTFRERDRRGACGVWAAALAGAALLNPVSPAAQERPVASENRLIFLGADPLEGLPGPIVGALGVLAFETLPTSETAADDVMTALLLSTPVSSFVSGGEAEARTADLHLVADLTLIADAPSSAVASGGEALTLGEFTARLSALMTAFRPEARRSAYIRLADPEDLLPQILPDLRAAIDAQDFALTVVMVDRDGDCTDEGLAMRPALHYDVLSGVPDRTPFGSGDGVVSLDEAETYLRDTLAREASRGMPCAADYSVILSSDTATGDIPIARTAPEPLIPALDEAVYLESFASLFLNTSTDATAIGDFLRTCRYCPAAADLAAVQRDIGEGVRLRALESEVWSSIRTDETPDRIEIYLENCQLCVFRDEAEARLSALDVAFAARNAERVALGDLMEVDDLDGLLRWLSSCVACEGREEVEARVASLEAGARLDQEAEALELAIARHNPDDVAAWLASCALCAQRDEAETALARIEAETVAAAPCIALAGLPQQGGPGLLTDIDQEAATSSCDRVLTDYPGSAMATTLRGRVALAANDADAAIAGYAAGMAAGLPQAFGLAAHNLYAPLEGAEPDYAAAERLAVRGYDAGDWLSGEVLVVLYSRELVPGRTASDAYDVAVAQAEAGNPVAQFFAGFFLATGTGTAPSIRGAVNRYQQSVDQGYMHAASYLAAILESGAEGVAADADRAADLYLAAIAAGDPTARERLTVQVRDRPRDLVAALQTRLRDADLYSGSIDGIAGRGTARAVEAYADLYTDAG